MNTFQSDILIDLFQAGVLIALVYVAYYYLTPKKTKKEIRKMLKQFFKWILGGKKYKHKKKVEGQEKTLKNDLKDIDDEIKLKKLELEIKSKEVELEKLKNNDKH